MILGLPVSVNTNRESVFSNSCQSQLSTAWYKGLKLIQINHCRWFYWKLLEMSLFMLESMCCRNNLHGDQIEESVLRLWLSWFCTVRGCRLLLWPTQWNLSSTSALSALVIRGFLWVPQSLLQMLSLWFPHWQIVWWSFCLVSSGPDRWWHDRRSVFICLLCGFRRRFV